MSTLEKEAADRKAKLAQLRAKRSQVNAVSDIVPSLNEEEDDEQLHKKPKLVQHRNFIKTNDPEKEHEEIEKLVLKNNETVETVSRQLEKEILSKYDELSKLDWTNLGEKSSVDNRKKVQDEYKEKLKLQELELIRLTNQRIRTWKKEITKSKRTNSIDI